MASFNFRVIECRIRLFPTLKNKMAGSETLKTRFAFHQKFLGKNCVEFHQKIFQKFFDREFKFYFWWLNSKFSRDIDAFWCFVILKLWSDQEGSKSSHAQHPRAHWLIHFLLGQSKSILISREKKC